MPGREVFVFRYRIGHAIPSPATGNGGPLASRCRVKRTDQREIVA